MSDVESSDDVVREALAAGIEVSWSIAPNDTMTAAFRQAAATRAEVDALWDRYVAALEREGCVLDGAA